MYEIDPRRFNDTIADFLLARGTGVPPLQWYPDRAAVTKLTGMKTVDLLTPDSIKDDNAARCVVAGLALWCGYPQMVEKICGPMTSNDALYWRAIAARQATDCDKSQALFNDLGSHPIYGPLQESTLELIGLATEKRLKKITRILTQLGTWEPYSFVNLFEQARNGETATATTNTVCTIQQFEFYLLLEHCYTAAIQKAKSPATASA